jgi:UDP:flavonoid glycosyltransferase YjiC (YdhE family)
MAAVAHDWLFPQMAAAVAHGGAGTIGQVVWDVAMRQRAKQFGQHIRAEDGVARAVETFGQIIVQ